MKINEINYNVLMNKLCKYIKYIMTIILATYTKLN